MPFPDSRHLWRVWLASTRASLVREMEFRANFVAGLIRQTLWLFIFVLMIEVIFQNTTQLVGWERAEALLIIGLSRFIEGLMGVFFIGNIMELPGRVQEGMFDFHVTKPVPVQLYTAFRKTHFSDLGSVIAGLILCLYALAVGGITVSLTTLLIAVGLMFAGVVIYYSLLIAAASLVFILDRLEFLWGFSSILSEPLTVPFDVFPFAPRVALTYLIPIAFVVFVPAQALTGRLVFWQVPLAIAIALLFLFLSNVAWRAGLRRYSSASS